MKTPWGTVAIMVGAVVVGLVIGILTEPFGLGLSEKGRAACDRYIATLLTSNDQTEIMRAGIIVRQAPCNISRRLE